MYKILYVEDNFQNFRLVSRMLQREKVNYEVVRAEDGESGLKLVNEFAPDLILMDINLPDIDGVEVTRRIKADSKLSTIPVIALTANAMVGDRERYLDAGCDDYLRKPLKRTDLRTMLEKYLKEEKKVELKKVENKTEVENKTKVEKKMIASKLVTSQARAS